LAIQINNSNNGLIIRDYNHDGLITASDFREGAYRTSLGFIEANIAQSAFNAFDRNHKGYLDRNDAFAQIVFVELSNNFFLPKIKFIINKKLFIFREKYSPFV
jgi:hypothetical protein